MARRVSWTNNSSGHSGTYVYRAPTLDPQNLPAPMASVEPVAQGVTAEWIDNEELAAGDYDYAVRDYDGSGEGVLSAVASYNVPLVAPNIGDEWQGGIYAGTHTNGSSTWHVIFAKQLGESATGPEWGNYGTTTGADDPDDGKANQELILASFDDGSADAFYHCRDFTDGAGNSDYYLPARNEIALVDALVNMSHAEFSTDLSTYRWSSTASSSFNAWGRRFSDGYETFHNKDHTTKRVRPVRRVAV